VYRIKGLLNTLYTTERDDCGKSCPKTAALRARVFAIPRPTEGETAIRPFARRGAAARLRLAALEVFP
jgi:hypothetical protein